MRCFVHAKGTICFFELLLEVGYAGFMLFQKLLEKTVILPYNFHALATIRPTLLRFLVDPVAHFH